MALFEVSRVWDAWPKMTGSQALRGLFRQVPTHSSAEEVCGVFMTCSHMFVATRTHDPNGDRLYVFSVSGVGNGGDCQVPITAGGEQIVCVISIRGEGEVCVVREKGFLEQFSQQDLSWKGIATAQLSGLYIYSCALHPATHSIVYCVGVPGRSASHTYQVLSRCYKCDEKTKDGSIQLGEPTALLLSCPAMSLWSYEAGVAMVAASSSPSPSGFLLLWLPHQSPQLQPFLINRQSPAAYSTPFSNHYPALCLQLAPFLCGVKKEPWLVSVTVAMTTSQLLLLLSSGEVVVVVHTQQQKRPQTKPVVHLKDFCVRYHMPGSQLQLFSIHTHYGIFCKGELRVYDGYCGEMVWENDEHEGHEVQLLAPPSSCSCIGIHDNSGVWVLRSRRLSEHTQLVSQALFPITTNADETTPGDYLEEGRVLAAVVSCLWGLKLPATRHGLEALHGIVKQDREEDDTDKEKHLFLPLLSTQLEAVLRNTELQSPALLVSLLAEHPRHRQLLSGAVAQFLSYVDCHGDSVTPMTKEVVAQIRLYHSLSQAYSRELTVWRTGATRQLLLPPQPMATSLLHKLDGCHGNTRLGVRAQLHLLSCSAGHATLNGIRDYLALPSFEHAVEQLHTGVWSSDRDWKTLLSTDTGCGVNRGMLQSLPPNVPLFELICRLLYRDQPNELEHFVTFAQLARDFQAQGISSFARRCRKTYFFQRALQCLPQFVSPEATPTSREALLTHAHLILQSGRRGCEGSALRLLLKARLWEDALLLVEQETAHTSPTYCALYHTLLATLAQEGALHCYMDRAWQLIPKTFSVFDFLSVLGELPPLHPTPLLVHNNTSLTVADIGSRLQELL